MAAIVTLQETRNPDTGARHWLFNAGGPDIYVGFSGGRWSTVGVCVMNASHRVWRGAGRTFRNWDDALAAYRSAPVRAAIEAARDSLAT